MKRLDVKFWFGDIVFLKQDPDQYPRIVTDIEFNGGPENPKYHLQSNGYTTPHYEYEISEKKDLNQMLGIQ